MVRLSQKNINHDVKYYNNINDYNMFIGSQPCAIKNKSIKLGLNRMKCYIFLI